MKADTASLQIPELEFEIPPRTQEGSITTVESILMQAVEGLKKEQPIRKVNSGGTHKSPSVWHVYMVTAIVRPVVYTPLFCLHVGAPS